MKIILDHNEFLFLQTINARPEEPFVFQSRTKQVERIINFLYEGGLIKAVTGTTYGIFNPVMITPLGSRVLHNHLPWIDGESKIFLEQKRFMSYEI